MVLSKACEYGLRAALHLAATDPASYVPIRTVSEALGIPYPYLAKIAQTLVQHGILTSSRGAAGGIRLARAADVITLKEIVLAVDGPALFRSCVLGLPGCGDERSCPLHDEWAVVRARIETVLAQTTLAALGERLAAGEGRLGTTV